MHCWICKNFIYKYYHLLPDRDDDIIIPKSKYSQITTIDNFTFYYYKICPDCLTMYLDNYPINFKKIMKRELGKKN